jgi:hypothetical protein
LPTGIVLNLCAVSSSAQNDAPRWTRTRQLCRSGVACLLLLRKGCPIQPGLRCTHLFGLRFMFLCREPT